MKTLIKHIWKWVLILTRGKTFYARSIGVKIGNDCRIRIHNWGSEPFLINIGNRVWVTAHCIFLTHDGSTNLITDEKGRRQRFGRIKIGNNVFIGARSTFLPGVTVGDNCVIGTGSVVTKSIPSGYVVSGNPARIMCTLEKYIQSNLDILPASADVPQGLNFQERVLWMVDRCPYREYMSPRQ
jgi:acetyltransferase-like isoleucine patch superfamily enzyme